jgi:hypothetical protein
MKLLAVIPTLLVPPLLVIGALARAVLRLDRQVQGHGPLAVNRRGDCRPD